MDAATIIDVVWQYLLLVVMLSLRQFVFLFGILFLLGFLIYLINISLLRKSYHLLGAKPYLWVFGWFSVPVHELGHAIFALIFGHKIQRLVLFDPQAKSGSHGYVQHTWNTKNVYHKVGNLFIGVGPIIFGSLVIWVLTRVLLGLEVEPATAFDAEDGVLEHISSIPMFITNSLANTLMIFRNIFSGFGWKNALFLFLSFGISTNINLSEADIKHIMPALVVIIEVILVFNLLTAWLGNFSLSLLGHLESGMASFYGILFYVMVLNLGFLLIIWLLRGIIK